VDITTKTNKISRIIRNTVKIYIQVKEMDKFLNIYDLFKLTQEDINYLNRFIMSNAIETVIKIPKQKTIPESDRLMMNPTSSLKKN
jgi:hypothetical protein